MAKREIQCKHNIPISQCTECYPVFLRETSVGDYLDNPLGFSNELMMRGYQQALLTLALNHNAGVVELAAALISAGEIKRSSYKRFMSEFKRLHKNYNETYEKIVKKAEEEFKDEQN